MARKKRTINEIEAPVAEPKTKTVYRDSFQQTVGGRLEDAGKKIEGKGRNLLYAIAALAVLIALFGIYSIWNRRSEAAALTAFGKALETSQAQVTTAPPPAGSTAKTFKTERERAEAAISEFQAVAEKYGSPVREKAKYFIAVNRLIVDRPAGIAELQALSGESGEVGTMAKFALAQALAADGKLDEAAALYQQLAQSNDPILSKDTINFNLAEVYRKQGKTQEAADLFYNIAKTASEAKDLDGKAIPLTETAKEAKKKLAEINPDRAREIPDPLPTTGPGGTATYNF
jgi:tetratricopeptide (TPR) repeat protein